MAMNSGFCSAIIELMLFEVRGAFMSVKRRYEICTYDEGFISSLLESFTGMLFQVKEIDCWCTGDRTCRFTAKTVPPLRGTDQ